MRHIRTMEEFSAASGISRPTLSRFFNDPQSVRPASRARIEAAIARFGYRPNLFALNFNRRNPKTLGILVPSLTDPFYAGIVQCLERQALEAGYWTLIQNCQGAAEREAEALATLMSLKVAGIVAIPLGDASRDTPYHKAAASMPLVFVDARPDNIDATFVGTDNRQSMGLIVDYLLRSGSPPLYFDMPDVNQNARERRDGYRAAMSEHGHEPQRLAIEARGWDFEQVAFDRATMLFRNGVGQNTTILCANDRIAFGVMAAASQAGLSIGRAGALRIAGHDDHPLSRFSCPSLTTVAQDGEAIASTSLRLLLGQMGESSATTSAPLLEGKLMMRNSA